MASVSTKNVTDGQSSGSSGTSGGNSTPTKTIYFIEPLDGLPVDNKDLFIYVNLTATRKARSVLQLTQDTNPNIRSANTNSSEINLIGYKQDKDGNIFMTTDWSTKPQFGKVTDLDPNVVNNVFEGFGVTDIDINITAMNPPTVNIKFIDTRGGGLFDQETFSNLLVPVNSFQNTSPYAIFFEMPPPLFYLTLKGFYGNPVTLCLYLLKWDGNFNSETGNFEISANFIGYTFAFLQDIKIGHLIGASNTLKGREKLREVTNRPTTEGYIFPYVTLDDLALKFERITINREKEQKDSPIFNQLKVINEQIRYIKNFRSLIGSPASSSNTNNLYGSNLDTTYITPNVQQIFFRDVGVIAEGAKDNYKNVISVITNGAKKYKEFKDSQQGADSGFLETGFFTIESLQIPKPEFKDIPQSNVKNTVNDALTLINKLIQENEPNSNIPLVTMADFTGKTQNNWPLDSKVGIINLKNDRKKIDDCLNALLTKKQQIENNIKAQQAKEITETLGFTPNIRNIVGILCNNIEMFLSLIYDVGKNAESNAKERYYELGGNFTSDTPKVNTGENIVYPFPKVVDKEYKEIYLGDDRLKLTKDNYPEIPFVDELCNGLVYSIKQNQELQNSKYDTEKVTIKYGFPISTVDVNVNPYGSLDVLENEQNSTAFPNGTINSEIVDTIIKRMYISYILSNYTSDNFNEIANLEAINFFTSIESEKFVNIFKQVSAQEILNIAEGYGIIKNVSGTSEYEYYLPFTSIAPFDLDSNGSTNSGNRLWDTKIVLKDKVAEELKLNDNSNPQIRKFTSPKRTTKYIWRGFDNKNVLLNKSYLSLGVFKEDSVKGSILGGKSLENFNLLESYDINTLSEISLVPTFQKYFQLPASTGGPTINFIPQIKIGEIFTKSSIYKNSDNFGKAYLILSSFLLEDDNILLNEIKSDYAKIIRLPELYLLWLGANSYRYNNPTEILSFDSNFPPVPKDKFYYITRKRSEGNANNRLGNLMENFFTNWVFSASFINLKDRFEYYLNTDNLGQNDKKTLADQLNEILFKEYDLIINNPDQVLDANFSNTINITQINSYINTFKQKYDSITSSFVVKQKTDNEEKNKTKINDVVNDPDIKKAFYIDLKHIYDNWIAGNENDKIYTCCKTVNSKGIKLFDLFKFVDKFRNPVAGDAIININSFNDLARKRDVGLFSFISKILTDSYFMHFTLPIYVEFYKPKEVKSIFEPQTTLEKLAQSPTLLCVYNGPPSSSIKSGNYVDDSFKFNDTGSLPPSVYHTSGEKNPYLIAFNVNYGSQFQSIFKNVQVGTQESKITGEYITLLSNYTVGTGESKPLIKDNSLFTIMRSRSYTSSIQMLGNMMIQPQMYFQLNNIPFFTGSYMIMNVSHSVKPNSMYTTFKGVRQNNSPVEVIKEVTSFLNFQFDQGVSSGFSFTEGVELVKTTPVDKTQLSAKTTANITTKAKLDFRPTVGSNILRSFNDKTELHRGIDIEVDSLTSQIKSVDIKGTVLYNLQGNDTTNGKLIIKHDPDTDGYTYFTAYFAIKNNSFTNGGRIASQQIIGNPSVFKGSKKEDEKFYYHYEVRRTKGQINSYEEFLNSPQIEIIDPQQFSSNLNIKNMDTALHDNTIYEEKIKGIEAERKLPFIGGYQNDVFNVKIDPTLEPWKIFSLNYDYRGTAECIDEGTDQTFDRNFISADEQSVTITKQDLLKDVYCLSEPLSAQTGTYYFNITVYANPYTTDGKLDINRNPSQAIKSYRVTFTI